MNLEHNAKSQAATVGAVIVTYRRIEIARLTLAAVLRQSLEVSAVVVVDNDPDASFQKIVKSSSWPTLHYLSVGKNLGYGAGLAMGMRFLDLNVKPDWFWLLDDDSPPETNDLEQAFRLIPQLVHPWVIGNRGGHIRFGRIVHDLSTVSKVEEADFTLVDGALVSEAAVRSCGFPREDFFMMCEDLEYTSRLKNQGGRLYVRPSNDTALHLGSQHPWRCYYQSRNHLVIAISRRSLSWFLGWVFRLAALSLVDVRRCRWRSLGFRYLGALDGMRGRMGQTVSTKVNNRT